MDTLNKTQYGLCRLGYAIRDDSGNYGAIKMMPGAISLGLTRNDDNNGLAADNGKYDGGAGSKTVTGELNVARFSNDWLVDLCGYIVASGGIGEGDGEFANFALVGEVSGNLGGFRFVWYDCTTTAPTATYQTIEIDGTITYATETATITSKIADLGNDLRLRSWKLERDAEGYDTFFESVFIPTAA